jgi:hypothetical protein
LRGYNYEPEFESFVDFLILTDSSSVYYLPGIADENPLDEFSISTIEGPDFITLDPVDKKLILSPTDHDAGTYEIQL